MSIKSIWKEGIGVTLFCLLCVAQFRFTLKTIKTNNYTVINVITMCSFLSNSGKKNQIVWCAYHLSNIL